MKPPFVFCLALLALLVTGCPYNEYVVELTPQGRAIDRRLIFYRMGDPNTNGAPNYQAFPAEELEVIRGSYPTNALVRAGGQNIATGRFTGKLPADIGGAGWFTNVETSLGSGSFYMERFRGNAELTVTIQDRYTAADDLADLALGWSARQFGGEPNYRKLRRFIDRDFRSDLKNFSLYWLVGGISSSYQASAREEFISRYAACLIEHGYVKLTDAPVIYRIASGDDSKLLALVQRFIVEKLELAGSPLPPSLAIITNPAAFERSWTNYIVKSDVYRKRLRLNDRTKNRDAAAPKPTPAAFESDLFWRLVGSDFVFNTSDRVTVRLALPTAPTHTNGKWDDVDHRVLWEAALNQRPGLDAWPVFCYASWADPAAAFQKEHFGRTILQGDPLLQYCLWYDGLNARAAGDWDHLLTRLNPENAEKELTAFRFPQPILEPENTAYIGRDLLRQAFEEKER
jgi:hypothetical protein